MKNYLPLLLILNMINLSILGQNIIHNASFEDKDDNEAPWTPSTHSSVEKMQIWEDDMSIANDPAFIGQTCAYMHSPDWYKYGSGHIWLKEILTTPPTFPTWTPVLANTGDGYVGMGSGELIEQQFFTSNPIKQGVDYTMSMYIRLFPQVTVTNTDIYEFGDPWPLDGIVHLKVFLSTQKIKYSTNPVKCDNIPSCADGDDSFDDHYQITNHIKEIQDIPLDITNYPVGIWHKITFTFNSPTNYNYDWIAIEEASSTDCKNLHYIGLDDISLIESCALGCYPTSGIPSPSISTNSNAPLKIDNIQNVRTATLKIYTATGAGPIYQYSGSSNNGLTNPIYWNGYDSNGSVVANAAYTYSLTLENDCGVFNFGGNCVKVYEGDASTQNTFYTNDVPSIPFPCCVFNLNFSNQILSNTILYSVINNITAGNNTIISSNSNIVFEAGNSIILEPGFSTSPNTTFIAQIQECARALTTTDVDEINPDSNTNNPLNITSTEAKKIIDEKNNFNINVNPNPASNEITIEIETKKEDIITINLYDINTHLVKTIINHKSFEKGVNVIKFNCSEIANGVYFIKIGIGNEMIAKKIAILK